MSVWFLCSRALNYHPTEFASYTTSPDLAVDYNGCVSNTPPSSDSIQSLIVCVFSTGKAFEITYLRLKFYTSRPESFAIYKRTEENGPWLPYQYYSASCRKTYGKDAKGYIRPGDDERTALCTDEFSDISPLSGGNVAFSTLEGRPSAYNFDQSVVLQVRPHVPVYLVYTVNISELWFFSPHIF